MDDKKRRTTGSYPGAGGRSKPKRNSANPAGSYPGAKPAAKKPASRPKAEPVAEEPTLFHIPKAKKTAEFKAEPKAAPREERPAKPLAKKTAEPKAAPREEMPKAKASAAEPKAKKKKFKFPALFSKETMQKYWKTLAYYTGILIASVLLATWVCGIGNEVLGLIRPDKEITVEIPEGSSTRQIAAALKDAGIIDHPVVFQLYCKMKKADSELKTGEFTINCKSDYNQLIRALKQNAANKTMVSFTIEPGDTQEDLVVILCDSLGYLTREELEPVLQDYDFSDYSFLKKLPERNYRLEGYLYPGTYEMYEGESALAVVQRILDRFQEQVLTAENQKKIDNSGYTLDELITLASILQEEGGENLDKAAGVYFNRLRSESFPYLESQATVAYILPADSGDVTASDIRVDDAYNTYRNKGLTPGPITNPGGDAIGAVLDPEETDAFYFITQSNGKTLFAASNAEQLINLKKAGEGARGTGTIS